MNRLKEGYVLTRNPMNASQISRVTLSPEIIDCIVFWTKDPSNMMDKISTLDALGYHYYFQFTLTPYGRDIERNLRDKNDLINTFRRLSAMIGKYRVIWRYDPIILNTELTMDYHCKAFSEMCSELKGFTEVCTISFVDIYQKLNKTIKEDTVKEITEEQMHLLAKAFHMIAEEHDIELTACCEKTDLSPEGIKPASCIDRDRIERICGSTIDTKKDKNQRLGCGCIQSVDIGIYNTCGHGCVYCYANHSDVSIQKNMVMHHPTSDILIGEVDSVSKIIDRN